MNLAQYQSLILQNGFDEYPACLYDGIILMESFIDYNACDNELKIHLATVSLNRNFSATDGHEVLTDQYWLLNNFLKCYQTDLIRPWLSQPIKEAITMIVSDDHFSKYIIGTTFMFGIIEFYAKYLIGYRPDEANTFDEAFHKRWKEMSIGQAINKLKKSKSNIAPYLNRIDKLSQKRLQDSKLEVKGWTQPAIAERLSLYRNFMLHGQSHNHYSIGKYLCILYMLFYLCNTKT